VISVLRGEEDQGIRCSPGLGEPTSGRSVRRPADAGSCPSSDSARDTVGAGRRRQRGVIDELPSGALRVRVPADEDPITGRRHSLVEIIPAGPKAAAHAAAARPRRR
jgi:hypothetical protein